MRSLASQKDEYLCHLNENVFSKYAYSVPILFKAKEAVVSAFLSILPRTGRKLLIVRTEKGKVFCERLIS